MYIVGTLYFLGHSDITLARRATICFNLKIYCGSNRRYNIYCTVHFTEVAI